MKKLIGILVTGTAVLVCVPCLPQAKFSPLDPGLEARHEEFLKKYDDPEARKKLYEESLAKVRERFAGFDRRLNLDAATFSKFIELSADLDLAERNAFLRCSSSRELSKNPPCNGPALVKDYFDRESREVTALLGASGYQEMRQWIRVEFERRWVENLARKLPKTLPLSDSQADTLIQSYIAENKAVIQEYEALGKRAQPYISKDSLKVLYDGSVPSLEERMASARSYTQRIRERVASNVLSPEQLVVFDQMLEESLRDLERFQRNPAVAKYEGQPTIAGASAVSTPMLEFSITPAEFLAKYDDPEGRKQLLESAMIKARGSLEGFDKKRKIEAGTFEKLVNLTAEHELERRALQFRRTPVEGARNAAMEYRAMVDRQGQDVTALLGPGGYEASRYWIHSQHTRRVVKGVANRMPVNLRLTDAQSDALVKALQTAHDAVFREAGPGKWPVPFSNTAGTEVMYQYKGTSTEERMASARRYSQRMRDQAATVLSGEQLAVFNQMQDEVLSDLERHLRGRQAASNSPPGHPAVAAQPRSVLPIAASKAMSLNPRAREHAEQFLAKYDDPVARQALLAPVLARTRTDLEGFDQERKLDAATFDKLVRLVAEHALTAQAEHLRCITYSECEAARNGQIWNRHIEAVDALIGQNGYNHYKSWMHSNDSRRFVKRFSSHLRVPLTTSESNALLDELATPRNLYTDGFSPSGQVFAPFVDANGTEVLYSLEVYTVDEQMASARAYSKHIRGLASNALKGDQLRTFNTLQDQALSKLLPYLIAEDAAERDGS